MTAAACQVVDLCSFLRKQARQIDAFYASRTNVPDLQLETQIIIDLFAARSFWVKMLSRCSTSPEMTRVSQAPQTPSLQLNSTLQPADSNASSNLVPGGTWTVLPDFFSSTVYPTGSAT